MGDQRHHEHKPRPWTQEDHEKLVALKNSGHSIKEICRQLGRANSSVCGRLKNTDEDGHFISRRECTPLADLGIDDQLLDLHRAEWSQGEIGLSIGFRRSVIGARIRMLLAKEGAPTVENPDRKKRTCICCKKTFVSDSWDHRRCSSCRLNLQRSGVFHDEWSIHV